MTSPTHRLASSLALVAIVTLGGCRTAASGGSVAAPDVVPALPLRIMSFNLRLDVASDGPNAWPHRRDWVASLIRFHAPDAVGVQEALAHMLTDLDARLPGFARVGVGRADGRARRVQRDSLSH
jgi:hypothetical protein